MGTSRAFQIDSTAGAYGSLAIGLTGLTTAILAPAAYAAFNEAFLLVDLRGINDLDSSFFPFGSGFI